MDEKVEKPVDWLYLTDTEDNPNRPIEPAKSPDISASTITLRARINASRRSYGILALTIVPDEPAHVLLVKRRVTYQFCEFVHGHWSRYNKKRLISLFNNMTAAEKVDILSLNFDYLWYRVWLLHPPVETPPGITVQTGTPSYEFYRQKREYFESTFKRDDGKRLNSLVRGTSNKGTLWAIPKGHKGAQESEVECAVREFYEETSIEKKSYKLINRPPISYSYTTLGTNYISRYFIALVRPGVEPKVRFRPGNNQLAEVDEVAWFPVDRLPELSKGLASTILAARKIAKKFLRG